MTFHHAVDLLGYFASFFAIAAVVFAIWDAGDPAVCPCNCPTVECPERCSAADCNSLADAECEKFVGPGAFVMHYCAMGEP